jgi:hypothetical protein
MFKLQVRRDEAQVAAHELEAFDLVDAVGHFWEEFFDEVSEGGSLSV